MVDLKAVNPSIKEEENNHPRQEEMVLATVQGRETTLPEDLYVPPNALKPSPLPSNMRNKFRVPYI